MKALHRALLLAAAMAAGSGLAVWMEPRAYLADRHPREKLATLIPSAFGQWRIDRSIVPIPPSPDLQRVLDETYDETLARTYRHADGRRVMLSVAYGRNQHKGMNTHRPEVCYPAQGFRLVGDTGRGSLAFEHRPFPVQRLVAQMGARTEPITYWLTVGDEVTSFGYPQRWSTIRHGLRGLVPDGVLVRLSSIDDDAASAYITHERFAQEMLAAMSKAQRARLIGEAEP